MPPTAAQTAAANARVAEIKATFKATMMGCTAIPDSHRARLLGAAFVAADLLPPDYDAAGGTVANLVADATNYLLTEWQHQAVHDATTGTTSPQWGTWISAWVAACTAATGEYIKQMADANKAAVAAARAAARQAGDDSPARHFFARPLRPKLTRVPCVEQADAVLRAQGRPAAERGAGAGADAGAGAGAGAGGALFPDEEGDGGPQPPGLTTRLCTPELLFPTVRRAASALNKWCVLLAKEDLQQVPPACLSLSEIFARAPETPAGRAARTFNDAASAEAAKWLLALHAPAGAPALLPPTVENASFAISRRAAEVAALTVGAGGVSGLIPFIDADNASVGHAKPWTLGARQSLPALCLAAIMGMLYADADTALIVGMPDARTFSDAPSLRDLVERARSAYNRMLRVRFAAESGGSATLPDGFLGDDCTDPAGRWRLPASGASRTPRRGTTVCATTM